MTFRLKKLDRQRKRVFRRERRSENWKKVNKLFKKEMKTAKAQFYQKSIANLKLAKPGKWFACLKKITSHDPQKSEKTNVDNISHFFDSKFLY